MRRDIIDNILSGMLLVALVGITFEGIRNIVGVFPAIAICEIPLIIVAIAFIISWRREDKEKQTN